MCPKVSLIAQPPRQPAVGGSNGKGIIATLPNTMKSLSLSYRVNETHELLGSDTGMGDKMAPEDGKSATTALLVVAIGTKKRIRLISR